LPWLGIISVTPNSNIKQYDQGVKAFKEAVRIQPDCAEAWRNLGATYYMQGKRDKVREIHAILRKLDSVMAEEYFNAFILP
jgi:tetratricopeptide (TPR) repeat protein